MTNGFLENFAHQRGPKKDKRRSISLPSELAQQFDQHCAKLGLNFNEGVLLLIQRELGQLDGVDHTAVTLESHFRNTKKTLESHREHTAVTPSSHLDHTIVTPSVTPASHIEHTSVTPTPRKRTTTAQPGRLTTVHLTLDGKLPCPFCGKWGSTSNFKRDHIDKHGLPFASKEEYLHDPEFAPIAKRMYEAEKALRG